MIKYIQTILIAFLVGCGFATALSSCSDDDGGGTPEITGVRITNPAKADSLFTASAPDSTIVILGRNLQHAQRVFINDQQVWFNPVFNTDHSIIVKVPSEDNGFKLTAFNSDLKDEIRVETNHGTAIYAFKIKAPYPSISRLQARYPRKAGDVLNIFGKNLVDVERVYFTDIPASQLDSTVWTQIGGNHVDATNLQTIVKDHHNVAGTTTYETTSQLSVQIPSLPYEKGALVVECTGGTVYFPFSLTLAPPTITGINTDMPVMGETLTVYGTEFVQVEAVTYGDVTLSPDEFTVAETEDHIDIVFARKPAEGSTPVLTVVTGGGQVSTPFYDYSTLLVDFDGRGADNGWGPNASFETANGTDAPYTADGTFARINVPEEGQQWWGTMVFFKNSWDTPSFTLPSFDVIPANASANNIYLAMEVYNNGSDYNNGDWPAYLRYAVWPTGLSTDNVENQWENGFEWLNYDEQTATLTYPVLSDIDGNAPQQQWYRHVVPLSVFPCYSGKSYADIVTLGLENFRIQSINQSTKVGKIDFCIDNVRIYYNNR